MNFSDRTFLRSNNSDGQLIYLIKIINHNNVFCFVCFFSRLYIYQYLKTTSKLKSAPSGGGGGEKNHYFDLSSREAEILGKIL